MMTKYLLPLVFLLFLFISCETEPKPELHIEPVIEEVEPPLLEFGFDLNAYNFKHDTVRHNMTLSHVLSPYGISQWEINKAAELAADSIVGLRYISENKPYLLLFDKKDTNNRLSYCVYPKNKVEFIVFDFKDSIVVSKRTKPHSISEKVLSGEIIKNSNLTVAINQQLKNINMTGGLTESISGLFAWTIDFFKLHPGDEFKVIYNEKSVEGDPYDIGKIKAAYFKHQGREYYSFYYLLDSNLNNYGVFNENGKEMKGLFLMSPVKFSRISSSFSGRRFHPVQKRWKAHLGTDYAAPKGTPILSTADGYVIAASYTGGNGNYVKVKHNDTYTTQYLHMTGFAKGIRKGVHVNQGEVIGYVGSTGLATGPHVCYRFWKNGKQVNHRSEKFPATTPMPDSLLDDYLAYIKPIKLALDSLSITPYTKDTIKQN